MTRAELQAAIAAEHHAWVVVRIARKSHRCACAREVLSYKITTEFPGVTDGTTSMTAQAFTPEAAAETERKRRSRYPEAAVSTEPVRNRNYRADCLGEIPPGAAYLGFTVEAAFAQNGRPYGQRCGVAVWGKVVTAAPAEPKLEAG